MHTYLVSSNSFLLFLFYSNFFLSSPSPALVRHFPFFFSFHSGPSFHSYPSTMLLLLLLLHDIVEYTNEDCLCVAVCAERELAWWLCRTISRCYLTTMTEAKMELVHQKPRYWEIKFPILLMGPIFIDIHSLELYVPMYLSSSCIISISHLSWFIAELLILLAHYRDKRRRKYTWRILSIPHLEKQ